jgi:hypothetical protein
MSLVFLSDRGCNDTHRSDRVPVGPARGEAGNSPGLQWPLQAIGSPGADFHHGQEWRQRSTNRPKIRLQSVPHITIVVSASVERKTALIYLSGDPRGPLPIALRSNHGARRCAE